MVIAIVIVIVGLVALGRLPIAQYPEITPPMVAVSATYTGASATNVEQSVATPVEQKVNGVEDMIYMNSTNSSDGRMTLNVSFEVGTDLDMANVLTQNRVSEAQASLPEEVKRLGVTVKKQLSFPLLLISLISPENTYDENFLTNYASINVVDELARIRGVGNAEVLGGSISEYAMRVWIRPDQLSKLNLTVSDITNAIREQNVLVPAGQIGGEPAPPGNEFTYTVQTGGRFETPEEFGEVVVRSNPDGSQVLLKDVSRIELGAQNYLYKVRLDGQATAMLQIFQLPDANGLEVAEQIFAAMERISKRFPDDLEYVISLDTTKPITAGIREIVITLFQAVALVILVVFIFLQNARSTLIPTLTVPVSLIGTFMVFPLLGFSINTLSLLGLVLAIGIVVDEPIVATSLSLIAVFVPVAAMGGITGRLYQQFAITIAISVAISSINALTLSPALASSLLKPPGEQKKSFLDGFFAAFNRMLDKTTEKFMVVSDFFLTKLYRSGILLTAIVLGIFFLFKIVPAGFVPEEDQGYVMTGLIMPDGASLQRTDQVIAQMEEIISRYDEVQNATSIAGYSIVSGTLQPNAGMSFIQLKDWDERPDPENHANQVVRRLSADFAREISGGIGFAFGPPAIPGLGTGSGFTIMLQDRGGNTPAYLAEETAEFIQAASARPEIGGIVTLFRPESPQIFLDIDDAKALKLGVPLSEVNSSVGAFLGGAYVNDFNRFGRLYKVYVQAEPEYRASIDGVRMFYVRNSEGDAVPLSTLVSTSRTAGPEFTNRFNLFRSAKLTGQPAPGFSSAQALSALEEVAAQVLPSDMSYSWADMSYQEKSAEGSGAIVFLMALVFVYLILSAQYESWSLPMSVLLGTPIAVFGAIGGLFIARLFDESYVNNVFAQIGLVMLIGLSAKNAILIVEFAKVESDKGKSAIEAAKEAARLRFRPILMTAFSFILGVLPLLIASGAGAEARVVMGMTVFSGMLVATVVGVLLVPALYVFVETYVARGDKSPPAATQPATSVEGS
jgi:HAE1 family hydrophobic/amphiphilic exporter-1